MPDDPTLSAITPRPPGLSAEERERRRGGFSPLDRLDALPGRTVERPWLHELVSNDITYRWLTKNRLMRNDEHGIEIRYRGRRRDDVICGARTIRPGIPGAKGYSWRMDQSVDHEAVCNIVGDHGEAPHIGVPADCADMTCKCSAYGCEHLVIVEFAIRSEPTATWETRHAG